MAPMRVVSLTCSNTEIVAALDCGHMLVGVDAHSDYPPALLRDLPRVGPDLDIDVDAVKRLAPDLVLASLTVPGHERIIERLEHAGLPYIAPQPKSLDDVYEDIVTIAQRLGCTARGTTLATSLRDAIVAPSPNDDRPRPDILIQWWPKPVIAPGRKSWVNALLEAAGGRNPIGDRDVESTPLSDEEVAELDPQAIVISWCGVKTEKYRPNVIYRNPAWSECTAIRKKQVYCVPEAHLGRPSQRLLHGYRDLADVVSRIGF